MPISLIGGKQSIYDLGDRLVGQESSADTQLDPSEQSSPHRKCKSLACDLVTLTRYQRHRASLQVEALQRQPSFRNIFLSQPGPERRRFSDDIQTEQKGELAQVRGAGETKRVLLLQVFLPFLLSGFGNVGAGLYLNYAQTWPVFREHPIFYMLLATIMAFKTNLEATLAARLSTCSNLGTIKTAAKKVQVYLGNLALVQTQSIVFGFMSGALVVLVGQWTGKLEAVDEGGAFRWALAARIVATSMVAISANELVSSLLILLVVCASERAQVNPDNVSTLIAAMLGDFSSVVCVSLSATLFHEHLNGCDWLFFLVIGALAAALPALVYAVNRNAYTAGTFAGTHLPLAMAVALASLSGLVFDQAVESFARIAIYQAVVNGVSVNLMAVQASRISTYLQRLSLSAPEQAREFAQRASCSPAGALLAADMNASVARWLIAMCLPAMSVYLCFIILVAPKHVDVSQALLVCALAAILAQVTIIQCLTYLVAPIAWRLDWDPDNVVIPILMSVSDCSGNSILLAAFLFLRHIGDPNSVGHK